MSFLERFFGGRASRHFRSGIRAFEAEQYREALTWFEKAMRARTAPGDPIGHLARFYGAEAATALGRIALEEGCAGEALRWLEPALRWNSRSPCLLELAAAAYLEQGDLEASEACVASLLRLDPRRLGVRLIAALLCTARGDEQGLQEHVEAIRSRACGGALPRALRRVLRAHAEEPAELAGLLREIVDTPQESPI